MVRVSIVIPTWNGLHLLEGCLDSVFKQDFHDFEVIVVDNASQDGTVKWVKKNYPAVRIIQNKENFGFAMGCNIGVSHAKGAYFVLLNNDTSVDKYWLSELVKVIESGQKIKGVGSLAFNKYSGKEYIFPGHGTSTFFFQNVLLNQIPNDIKTPVDFLGPGGGSCLYENDGELPFDDDYFMYGEDAYLALKWRLRGFTHKMSPTSKLFHEGEGSSKRLWAKKIFFQERNRWLNVLITFQPWTLARLAPLAMINMVCAAFYDPGNAPTRLKAYYWLITHPSTILQKRKSMQSNRHVLDGDLLKFFSCKFYEEYLVPNPFLKKIVLLLNTIQYWYCKITGLRTIEMFHIERGVVVE